MASKLTPWHHSILNRSAARPFRITHSRSREKRRTGRSRNGVSVKPGSQPAWRALDRRAKWFSRSRPSGAELSLRGSCLSAHAADSGAEELCVVLWRGAHDVAGARRQGEARYIFPPMVVLALNVGGDRTAYLVPGITSARSTPA
jgi:hypothetical protein